MRDRLRQTNLICNLGCVCVCILLILYDHLKAAPPVDLEMVGKKCPVWPRASKKMATVGQHKGFELVSGHILPECIVPCCTDVGEEDVCTCDARSLEVNRFQLG